MLAFIVFSLLVHAQQREQTGFSFSNFMKNRQIQNDTIWQFHRYDVYQWINDEYFLLHTAFLEWDSTSPNYKSVLWVDNNATDTTYKVIYSYDDSNRVVSTINQTVVNGSLVNYSKADQYYTSIGFDSLYRVFTWNTFDSMWKESKLRKLSYDNYNHLISDVNYVWDGQNWKIDKGKKRDFTYNEFGSIIGLNISYYHTDIHQWVNNSKTEFLLINDTTGEFNSYTVYLWKNNQ
ncbi:MAG: hypothetical protein DRJ09_13375 [Bacteroidetes bacterium]|nr:MAG: hypothetical protein DRJ09_13375 [Bacteroidota bacterium]